MGIYSLFNGTELNTDGDFIPSTVVHNIIHKYTWAKKVFSALKVYFAKEDTPLENQVSSIKSMN